MTPDWYQAYVTTSVDISNKQASPGVGRPNRSRSELLAILMLPPYPWRSAPRHPHSGESRFVHLAFSVGGFVWRHDPVDFDEHKLFPL